MDDLDGTAHRRPGPDDIGPLFRKAFPGERFLVVSNREPYEHRVEEETGEIVVERPAGGLTSALDPVLRAVGGVWIAWGSGDADREVVDEHDRVRVPPEDPSYTVRRLWFDQSDIRYYYLGYSNQFLWPLCHLRPALTRVRSRHWEQYRRVNRRFAAAVLEEAAGDSGAVWFQDYHLALAPALVRARRPDLKLAHFWHIPWPPLEIYTIAPQAKELLEGLAANDLLGFQLSSHGWHFMHCAEQILGAEVDWDARTVRCGDHVCHVGAFPISIDVDAFVAQATRPEVAGRIERLRHRYAPHGGQLGIGVDRMDYSKGLPERLKALDMMWERHPELRGRFTFVQVAVPSRTEIDDYDHLSHTVERLVWQINDRYSTPSWRPVHLITKSLPPEQLIPLYRAADVCLVSSLQDGMNLVAKEYVACNVGREGALLLSRFAGAAEELDAAIQINPYDPESFAERIRDALLMSSQERRAQMDELQRSLRTIYDWMAEFFQTWSRVTGGSGSRLERVT